MKSRPFTKLGIVLSDALRHSSDRFVRSRLDEPWLLLCSCHSDTASERHQNSEESFASVRAGAVTIDHFCLFQKARASHPCNKQLKMQVLKCRWFSSLLKASKFSASWCNTLAKWATWRLSMYTTGSSRRSAGGITCTSRSRRRRQGAVGAFCSPVEPTWCLISRQRASVFPGRNALVGGAQLHMSKFRAL